jgi:hypothetical protein
MIKDLLERLKQQTLKILEKTIINNTRCIQLRFAVDH